MNASVVAVRATDMYRPLGKWVLWAGSGEDTRGTTDESNSYLGLRTRRTEPSLPLCTLDTTVVQMARHLDLDRRSRCPLA